MAIKYTIGIDGDLLRVKASGNDDNLQQVKEYGLAIIEAAKTHNAKSALCDETELHYELDTFDTFESAKYIAEHVPGMAKLAIVCKREQMDDASFWETTAVNRGLQVRVFNTIRDAELWLAPSQMK